MVMRMSMVTLEDRLEYLFKAAQLFKMDKSGLLMTSLFNVSNDGGGIFINRTVRNRIYF
jgi:hypothetical protein